MENLGRTGQTDQEREGAGEERHQEIRRLELLGLTETERLNRVFYSAVLIKPGDQSGPVRPHTWGVPTVQKTWSLSGNLSIGAGRQAGLTRHVIDGYQETQPGAVNCYNYYCYLFYLLILEIKL